jgi:hypothetical protein
MTISKGGKNAEQLELVHFADGGEEWYCHSGNWLGSFLYTYMDCRTQHSHSWLFTQMKWNLLCSLNNSYAHVYVNFIHNCSKLEKAICPLASAWIKGGISTQWTLHSNQNYWNVQEQEWISNAGVQCKNTDSRD